MHDVQLLFTKYELHQMHIHKESIPLSSMESYNPRAWTVLNRAQSFICLSLRLYILSICSAPEDPHNILGASILQKDTKVVENLSLERMASWSIIMTFKDSI